MDDLDGSDNENVVATTIGGGNGYLDLNEEGNEDSDFYDQDELIKNTINNKNDGQFNSKNEMAQKHHNMNNSIQDDNILSEEMFEKIRINKERAIQRKKKKNNIQKKDQISFHPPSI